MPEVPEHLLRRSRERRAALGQGGGDDAAGDAPAATPATTSSAAPAPAAAPAAPAVVDAPAAPVGPDPRVVKLEEARRRKIPTWAFPALVALPFWAILYVGAFGSHQKAVVLTQAQIGQRVFSSAGCSGCHGAAGEGGVGPKLAGGEAKLTFPNIADQIDWVKTGSQTKPKGTPYGDPNRPGGQHIVKVAGMPAFSGTLSEAEIEAVVAYERDSL